VTAKVFERCSKKKYRIFFFKPGLPDGLFSDKNSQFWANLEGLGIENVAICIL
jgi:sugar lactone lactonase YvrE